MTKICIDDFALKKRHTYGTAIVDIDTHRIIDMIPSRDTEDVKIWLRMYPNIIVVARDGSNSYRSAVRDALPEALQVSDRFHLLKNLTDYAKEYLKKELSLNVKVASANTGSAGILRHLSKAEENRKLTQKEKYERIKALAGAGYGKTAICKELNMDVRVYEKLVSATPAELRKMFKLKNIDKHEENLKRKQCLVDEVRELKKQGFGVSEISRRTGINRKTVSRYLNPGFSPVHASYGAKRSGLLTPFLNEIDNMLSQGVPGTIVESGIREKGYAGSSSNVRVYIADWKNRRKQDYDKSLPEAAAFEIIERKNLFKLLYRPLEEVKELTGAQFEAVAAKYPAFEKIHKIVWEFKDLLKLKDANALKPWLERAASLGIAEINSFIEGIKQDMEAVMNAIAMPYSNGLAEGSINKIKVIKRVMYGRCGFELLKNKTLQLELEKTIN